MIPPRTDAAPHAALRAVLAWMQPARPAPLPAYVAQLGDQDLGWSRTPALPMTHLATTTQEGTAR